MNAKVPNRRSCAISSEGRVIFVDAYTFDKDQAIEILDSFNKVSGLGCTLYHASEDGKTTDVLYSVSSCKGMCPYASQNESELWSLPCQKTHAMAAHFADRFGGRYFYQCKEDRLFFSAPIVADGGMVATMTMGPVHIYEVEDACSKDPGYRSFPVRKPMYVQYMSNLLSSCAVCVSDSSQIHVRMIKQATLEQQGVLNNLMRIYKNEPYKEYPIDCEETLVEAIINADSISAKIALNDILAIIMTSTIVGSNANLRTSVNELKTVCARAAIRAGVSTHVVFEARNEYAVMMTKLKTNDQLCLHIQSFVEHMVSLVERLKDVEYYNDIYRATEYIRTHYMEHITLEGVAKVVAFSPSYFSRLFKKKMGCNFSAYLNQVHIDASKTALLSTNATASEIAKRVGYEDASYFTRVFKRLVGVSPGYYRSHRGRYDKQKELG